MSRINYYVKYWTDGKPPKLKEFGEDFNSAQTYRFNKEKEGYHARVKWVVEDVTHEIFQQPKLPSKYYVLKIMRMVFVLAVFITLFCWLAI